MYKHRVWSTIVVESSPSPRNRMEHQAKAAEQTQMSLVDNVSSISICTPIGWGFDRINPSEMVVALLEK